MDGAADPIPSPAREVTNFASPEFAYDKMPAHDPRKLISRHLKTLGCDVKFRR